MVILGRKEGANGGTTAQVLGTAQSARARVQLQARQQTRAREGLFPQAVTRHLAPTPVLLGLVGASLVVRGFYLLSNTGLWGVDFGAYHLSLLDMLGLERTGVDFNRPPFAPGLLLYPFVTLLGITGGWQAFALFCTIPLTAAVYLFSRPFLSKWQRVAASAVLAFDPFLGEMFTAGPLPMLGFAGILTAMWARWELAHGNVGIAPKIATLLSLPAIAFTNQTSVGIASYVLPVWGLSLAVLVHRRSLTSAWPWTLGGVALSALALPWYLDVAPGAATLKYDGPVILLHNLGHYTWTQFGMALLLLGAALWKGSAGIKAVAVVGMATSTMAVFQSYDETLQNVFYRSHYLAQVPMVITATWAVARLLSQSAWRGYALAASLPILAILPYAFAVQVAQARAAQQVVTASTEGAIAYLNEQQDSGRVLVNYYSLGLYVAALTQREVAWAATHNPPAAYAQGHADTVCILGWTECDVRAAIERQGAAYVLADTSWPMAIRDGITVSHLGPTYQAPAGAWDITARAPWLTEVYAAGWTRVWTVDAAKVAALDRAVQADAPTALPCRWTGGVFNYGIVCERNGITLERR